MEGALDLQHLNKPKQLQPSLLGDDRVVTFSQYEIVRYLGYTAIWHTMIIGISILW